MAKRNKLRNKQSKPKCSLCGKTSNLTKTECCDKWICDDEHKYVMFSYARNSCYRNHSRYTLCAFHYNEGHSGNWKTCQKCKEELDKEDYVYYGTNEYNFEKFENPPEYEPTRCSKCNSIIDCGRDGFSIKENEYYCSNCSIF